MTTTARTKVFEKTLSDGRTVTVSASAHSPAYVAVDGAEWTNGTVRLLPPGAQAKAGGKTHAIGGPLRILGLTESEASQIQAAMDRVTAEWDAARTATPESQRDDLAQALRSADSRLGRASERGSDEDDWSDYAAATAACDEAEAALDAFDAAHPELAARIAAEREAEQADLIRSAMNQ